PTGTFSRREKEKASTHRAFQRNFEKLLGLHRELHRQFAEDLLAEAVDDHRHGVFLADAAAAAVEHLVVGDLRGGGLVLDDRRGVLHFHVRERVRAAALADQQRVALGVVARALGALLHLHQAAVAIVALAGADALGDDLRLGVLADVDHLGAGVGLLVMMGQRHRVELAHRTVAAQYHAGVLPGDRRAGFHLGPADLAVVAAAVATLGDQVVYAAHAVLVAGIPVLHGGVLDLGALQRH